MDEWRVLTKESKKVLRATDQLQRDKKGEKGKQEASRKRPLVQVSNPQPPVRESRKWHSPGLALCQSLDKHYGNSQLLKIDIIFKI